MGGVLPEPLGVVGDHLFYPAVVGGDGLDLVQEVLAGPEPLPNFLDSDGCCFLCKLLFVGTGLSLLGAFGGDGVAGATEVGGSGEAHWVIHNGFDRALLVRGFFDIRGFPDEHIVIASVADPRLALAVLDVPRVGVDRHLCVTR